MLEKQRQVDNSTLVGNEFQALAFEHVDSLYNTAVRMTKNNLDAEDLIRINMIIQFIIPRQAWICTT